MKKLFFAVVLLLISGSLWAENSSTLPQGRIRARVKPIYAFEFSTQYGSDGTEQDLVKNFEKDFDVATMQQLNPQIAAAMAQANVPSLGTFDPSLKLNTLVFGTALEYGVTDRLTLGVIVPIVSASSKVELAFNQTPESQAVFGPMDFVPAMRNAAAAKGYQEIQDWDKVGLGDMELGVKYLFLNTENWGAATKTGVRLPTGKADNPDNLVDVGLGDGQTDLGTTLLVDYKGVSHTLLTVMLKYTAQLPDRQMLRVPAEGELFTARRDNLKRNLGDQVDAALSGQYTILKNYNLNAAYNFFGKEKDRYRSDLGFSTDRIEKNTDQVRHMADVGAGFSTIPWVKEGIFPIPMDLDFNVQIPVAGKNIAKVTSVNVEYKLYF